MTHQAAILLHFPLISFEPKIQSITQEKWFTYKVFLLKHSPQTHTFLDDIVLAIKLLSIEFPMKQFI